MVSRPFGGAPLTFVLVWTAVIVLWAMLCAGGWWYSTRDDYSRLAVARACEAMSEQTRLADPRCASASSAAADFAEINRKARISRLAAAGGGLVVLLIAMASRRRQQVE
jgi:hypothetical protein